MAYTATRHSTTALILGVLLIGFCHYTLMTARTERSTVDRSTPKQRQPGGAFAWPMLEAKEVNRNRQMKQQKWDAMRSSVRPDIQRVANRIPNNEVTGTTETILRKPLHNFRELCSQNEFGNVQLVNESSSILGHAKNEEQSSVEPGNHPTVHVNYSRKQFVRRTAFVRKECVNEQSYPQKIKPRTSLPYLKRQATPCNIKVNQFMAWGIFQQERIDANTTFKGPYPPTFVPRAMFLEALESTAHEWALVNDDLDLLDLISEAHRVKKQKRPFYIAVILVLGATLSILFLSLLALCILLYLNTVEAGGCGIWDAMGLEEQETAETGTYRKSLKRQKKHRKSQRTATWPTDDMSPIEPQPLQETPISATEQHPVFTRLNASAAKRSAWLDVKSCKKSSRLDRSAARTAPRSVLKSITNKANTARLRKQKLRRAE